MNHKETWDRHWEELGKEESLFGKICSLHRDLIISKAVKHFTKKYFPEKGIFIEMGSGTSGASSRIKNKGTLIAFDISHNILLEAKKSKTMNAFIQGDILKIPLKDNSVDGIWNLGVMEHFTLEEIDNILKEFHRVLKKGRYVILFWPPAYGSSQIILGTIEKILKLFGKNRQFFPDEISRLRNKKIAHQIMRKNRFKDIKTHFTHKDLYTHIIVVGKK